VLAYVETYEKHIDSKYELMIHEHQRIHPDDDFLETPRQNNPKEFFIDSKRCWNAQHSSPTNTIIHTEDVCHSWETTRTSDTTSSKHGEAKHKITRDNSSHFSDTH